MWILSWKKPEDDATGKDLGNLTSPRTMLARTSMCVGPSPAPKVWFLPYLSWAV